MSLSDCIFIPTDEDEEYVDALANRGATVQRTYY